MVAQKDNIEYSSRTYGFFDVWIDGECISEHKCNSQVKPATIKTISIDAIRETERKEDHIGLYTDVEVGKVAWAIVQVHPGEEPILTGWSLSDKCHSLPM